MIMSTDRSRFGSSIEQELFEFDAKSSWNVVFQRLKNATTVYNQSASTIAARAIENRAKNRYRDVSPYDNSRVRLTGLHDSDYINASYVSVQAAEGRRYILTQGPLQNTAGHFWLMVWQEQSIAIVMLNRIIEKGAVKCFPYFPAGFESGGGNTSEFHDVGLRVELIELETYGYYVCRTFKLEHMESGESRTVLHFHYLSWPDFGVPHSPGAFLNFLWAVRASGALSRPDRPAVIHCSAGIGRSGTFVLVDAALVKIDVASSLSVVQIQELLLELRRHRMGLIQTVDQLRFSYAAVVEGGRLLLETPPGQRNDIAFEVSPEDTHPPADDESSEDESDESDTDEEEEVESSDEMEPHSSEEGGATGTSAPSPRGHPPAYRYGPSEVTTMCGAANVVQMRRRRRHSSEDGQESGQGEGAVSKRAAILESWASSNADTSPPHDVHRPRANENNPIRRSSADTSETVQRRSSGTTNEEEEEEEEEDDQAAFESRRRARQERKARTRAQVDQIRSRMKEGDLERRRWIDLSGWGRGLFLGVGLVLGALGVLGVAYWWRSG